MGFKPVDLTPLGANGPTVLTPTGKYVETKLIQVLRTDTTQTVRAVLPADSTIISMSLFVTAVSNAGTTATVSVGNGTTGNFYINAADVKSAAGRVGLTTNLTNMFNLENLPLGADLPISVTYAETGGASSSGGPFYILIEYVR